MVTLTTCEHLICNIDMTRASHLLILGMQTSHLFSFRIRNISFVIFSIENISFVVSGNFEHVFTFSRLENWVNVLRLSPPTHRGALGPRRAPPSPRPCTSFGPMQDRSIFGLTGGFILIPRCEHVRQAGQVSDRRKSFTEQLDFFVKKYFRADASAVEIDRVGGGDRPWHHA